MSRERKPGEVAMVRAAGLYEKVMTWATDCYAPAHPAVPHWHPAERNTYLPDAPSTARPLVVIDPEDREQVERLYRLYRDQRKALNGQDSVGDVQAALREFADPPEPRPTEPTGLGAVVEDAAGWLWTRTGSTDHGEHWSRQIGNAFTTRTWDRVDVVRVLSPGYDPEATP